MPTPVLSTTEKTAPPLNDGATIDTGFRSRVDPLHPPLATARVAGPPGPVVSDRWCPRAQGRVVNVIHFCLVGFRARKPGTALSLRLTGKALAGTATFIHLHIVGLSQRAARVDPALSERVVNYPVATLDIAAALNAVLLELCLYRHLLLTPMEVRCVCRCFRSERSS